MTTRGLQLSTLSPADGGCHACGLCVQLCPAAALRLASKAEDGSPSGRRPDRFDLDVLACIRSASCVAICPVDALTLAPSPTFMSGERESWVDLLTHGEPQQS